MIDKNNDKWLGGIFISIWSSLFSSPFTCIKAKLTCHPYFSGFFINITSC